MVATATAAQLKARYPEFDGVGDAVVDAVIAEAAVMVDDEWEEGDQLPAILALSAHYLFLEGWPGRLTAPASFNPATSGQAVTAHRVGEVSVQYGSGAAGSASGVGLLATLSNSVYGQRFANLLKLNAPHVGLV